VGVFVPPWIQYYLLTYTLAKGLTKSTIVRKLIEDWVQIRWTTDTHESLLQEIKHKVRLEWKLEHSLHPGDKFFFFSKKTEQELQDKGLTVEDIKIILEEIE
jgi:hypothetical protein